MWQPGSADVPPDSFMEALYDDDDLIALGREEVVDQEEESDGDQDCDIFECPTTTRPAELTPQHDRSQTRRSSTVEPRSEPCLPAVPNSSPRRSRSPLISERSPAVEPRSSQAVTPTRSPAQMAPRIQPSPALEDIVIRVPNDDMDGNHFILADEHILFEVRAEEQPAEQRGGLSGSRRRGGRGGRGRGRGGRARGGRGRGRGSRSGASIKWKAGDPLTEIYLTDEDVPADLIALVSSIMRQRESRAAERRSLVGRGEESEDEDVFEDAEAAEQIFEAADAQFEWSSMDSFLPTEEPFRPEHTGPAESHASPYSAFRSYWDDGILDHIVRETNAYATKISSAAFQSEWVPTNLHEILVLFSFWMMLGIVRMPTIKSCFSTNALLETTVFRRMFTRKRYDALVRALHFVSMDPEDNAFPPEDENDDEPRDVDRMCRIRPILTHLNIKFKENYTPSRNICIDESLILWKGRLNIRQYIRSKTAKFGIKTFELCESVTGYLWSFFVYTGRHTSVDTHRYSGLQKSTAVVLTLIEPLLNKGYRLFMDNWFNSPLLSRYLKRNGTDCVGTLRPNRQNVPPLIHHCKLKQGQLLGRHSGDVCVMAWQDKKKVTTISTCHGLDQGLPTVSSTLSKDLFKPQVVLDYNKYMGGVDLKDQMLEPYLLERKRCMKWYMKLFKRLLNCSILNSRILLESSTNRHHDHLDFRLRLVDAILNNHLSLCPLSRTVQRPRHNFPSSSRNPQFSTHWPTRVTQTPKDAASGHQSRRTCFMCYRAGRKHQKSAFQCEQCEVPLCIEGCFKSYHLSS